jgi:Mn2+/Fe2+ NRAMP family transporter
LRRSVKLVRERFGRRVTAFAVGALLLANIGTLCAELAGVAVGAQLLTGAPRGVAVPLAALVVIALVMGSGFHRVEHVLLVLASVFVVYIGAGVLAHPDWSATASGLVVPRMPLTCDALLVAVATLGTTLAPWGLAFMQSYAVDKRLREDELPYERVDVVSGATLTGVIGVFVAVACAATLHPAGLSIIDGSEAAQALAPLAGSLASTLFGLGFLGAALLAAAIVPLSTAYSVCEASRRPAGLDATPRAAPLFYGTFAGALAVASTIVLIPSVPLITVLFLTQALNAVLLLAILPLIRSLASDRTLLGRHALRRAGKAMTATVLVVVAASCTALLVTSILR